MQPEASFRQRVHRRLKKADPMRVIHIQSMEAGNGTPDYYYEAPGTHLWVEYKVHPNKPSARQSQWITRARTNSQPVWLATWHPKKEVVIVDTGCHTFEMSIGEYVTFITKALTGESG